jgi:hypothetical protein
MPRDVRLNRVVKVSIARRFPSFGHGVDSHRPLDKSWGPYAAKPTDFGHKTGGFGPKMVPTNELVPMCLSAKLDADGCHRHQFGRCLSSLI